MKKATYIPMQANPGKAKDLASFLRAGRDLVAANEPQTPLWYALANEKQADNQAILDFFPTQAGRDAHFAGQVAAALKDKSGELVQGGWQDGVVSNVINYDVVAAKLDAERRTIGCATLVQLQAKPGKAGELEKFLRSGRDLVEATEPGTLYWFALRQEGWPERFAIFDLFEDTSGRAAHFAGKVAAALQEQSAVLVEGGWEDGVLKNVTNFSVTAAK